MQWNRHRVGHQQGEQGSCWGTPASMPVRSQPGSPVCLITISPRDPWPHTTSIITQPALPAAGAPPLTFTKDWKTTTKTTTTAEACWQLSYWHLQTSQGASQFLGLSHPRRLMKPMRLLTFGSDRNGSTGGTYAPEQLKLNQALPNIFLPVE